MGDFKILEKASELLHNQLRMDENTPDLIEQFTSRSDTNQRYYIEPYKSLHWGSMVEYDEFIGLPQKILDQYSNLECASFMGIIPEIDRAWITIDNKLFLWNFTNKTSEECEVYDEIKQVIISVAMTAPKPGIFLDTVKYVLVVATAVEVILLAISCDANGNQFQLIPTAYVLPSDNIAMIKIIGSQVGRIFMGGNDGNLYELDYTNYYDNWSILGESSRYKCRKINHFGWNWKITNVVPLFLKLFSNDEDSLVDLTVDNVRSIVYAVSANSTLSAFYFGPSGDVTISFIHSYNILEAAKSYLSSNRNLPECSPRPDSFTNLAIDGFYVISMHVLSITESKQVHLLVILGNGIRIYLSLTTPNGIYSQVPVQNMSTYKNIPRPSGIVISYIRIPPSLSDIRMISGRSAPSSDVSTDLTSGCVPSFVPSQALKISSALYSQGITFLAQDKRLHPDEVICMFEDLVSRSNLSMGLVPAYQKPSMREGINMVLDGTNNCGKVYDIKEYFPYLHNFEISKLHSLYANSMTPINGNIKDNSHHSDVSNKDSSLINAKLPTSSSLSINDEGDRVQTLPSELPVVRGSATLAMAATPSGAGYDMNDLDQITLLSEFSLQHIPCISSSIQRKFLVLSGKGMHIVKKIRPSDILYRHLVKLNTQIDEEFGYFFMFNGPLESSAMCIALACGLPGDAGGLYASSNIVSGSKTSLDTIQMKAISVMLSLTQGPSYKAQSSGMVIAPKDNRLIENSVSNEFVKSSAHDALYLVCSRILRPIWLRPLVQINRSLSSSLWTPSLIAEIRNPLLQFKKILRGFFAAAVVVDPHQEEQPRTLTGTLDIAKDTMTRLMFEKSQQNINPEKLLQQKAKRSEDISINSLYRLVSRSLQALAFIEILISLSNDWNVTIQWASLGTISFKSFVISPTVHTSVKEMIMSLINDMKLKINKNNSDQVINWLAKECTYYFSVGDRCLYEASKCLDTVQNLLTSVAPEATSMKHSQEIDSLSLRAVDLLIACTQYWKSIDSVSGDHSELYQQCTNLLEIGNTIGREGIVDICLAAAKTFSIPVNALRVQSMKSISDIASSSDEMNEENSWEQFLYRESFALNDTDKLAYRDASYQCLIYHIMSVCTHRHIKLAAEIQSRNEDLRDPLEIAISNMIDMIRRAVNQCQDDLFYKLLCERLLKDNQNELLAVYSPYIEQYLKTHDTQLLYRYYLIHFEYIKAMDLMTLLARDVNDCDINIRVSNLQKAIASAEKAVMNSSTNNQIQLLADKLLDLKDTLDIAEYQLKAYQMLSEELFIYKSHTVAGYKPNQLQQIIKMEVIVRKSKNNLLSISELFQEISVPYKLWDMCLMLLHVSKHQDVVLINRLWRSFIYRLVPDISITNEAQQFLTLMRDKSRIEEDTRRQKTGVNFESSNQWLSTLELDIIELGKQLNASAASGSISSIAAAFPSAVVLEELEEIGSMLSLVTTNSTISTIAGTSGATTTTVVTGNAIAGSRGWTASCFYDMGFTHGTLIEVYMEILDRWSGKSKEKILYLLSSLTYVMLQWTYSCAERSFMSESANTRQLIQSIRSGKVNVWIEKMRHSLNKVIGVGIPTNKLLATNYTHMSDEINKDIAEIKRRISEFTQF